MKGIIRLIMTASAFIMTISGVNAQNSLPAPGSGGSGGNSMSAPGSGGGYNPAPSFGGGWGHGSPGFGPSWGNPWGPGYVNSPAMEFNYPGWENRGVENVMACGYDAAGVWSTIPLTIAYAYNGIDYDVTVINAWNPYSQEWNRNINMPAYNTTYYTHGNTYNYYTPLTTGTYYFNL